MIVSPFCSEARAGFQQVFCQNRIINLELELILSSHTETRFLQECRIVYFCTIDIMSHHHHHHREEEEEYYRPDRYEEYREERFEDGGYGVPPPPPPYAYEERVEYVYPPPGEYGYAPPPPPVAYGYNPGYAGQSSAPYGSGYGSGYGGDTQPIYQEEQRLERVNELREEERREKRNEHMAGFGAVASGLFAAVRRLMNPDHIFPAPPNFRMSLQFFSLIKFRLSEVLI